LETTQKNLLCPLLKEGGIFISFFGHYEGRGLSHGNLGMPFYRGRIAENLDWERIF